MSKVSVPQQDGEIILSNPAGPKTYTVKGGQVDVPDADLEHFLVVVDGANPASAKQAAEAPPTT